MFSESDGLSGLTVDRYGRWLVAQFTSLALFERRELLLRLLAERTGAEGIIARTERGIASREGLKAGEEQVVGSIPDGPVEIVEHGLRFKVDLRGGQKTGFYLDQRDNRRAVGDVLPGTPRARPVLLHRGFLAQCGQARRGGRGRSAWTARPPRSIGPASTRRSTASTASGSRLGDVLEVLDRLRAEGQRFGVVICDPPKYARQAKDVEHALKGYLRLNLAALDVLAPDGILVTCSCSGLVGRELFADLLGQVAEQSRRPIQILEQRGQAPDHPVSASCLETEYLKCLICRVE